MNATLAGCGGYPSSGVGVYRVIGGLQENQRIGIVVVSSRICQVHTNVEDIGELVLLEIITRGDRSIVGGEEVGRDEGELASTR